MSFSFSQRSRFALFLSAVLVLAYPMVFWRTFRPVVLLRTGELVDAEWADSREFRGELREVLHGYGEPCFVVWRYAFVKRSLAIDLEIVWKYTRITIENLGQTSLLLQKEKHAMTRERMIEMEEEFIRLGDDERIEKGGNDGKEDNGKKVDN